MEQVEIAFFIEMAHKTNVTLTRAVHEKIKRANAQSAKRQEKKMRRGIGKVKGNRRLVEKRFGRGKEHLVREMKRRRAW